MVIPIDQIVPYAIADRAGVFYCSRIVIGNLYIILHNIHYA